MDRGIILTTTDVHRELSGGFSLHDPDPLTIRNAILYWDKIVFSELEQIQLNSDYPDIQFLIDNNLGSRVKVNLQWEGQMSGELLQLIAQEFAFHHFNKIKGQEDLWSIGRRTELPLTCQTNNESIIQRKVLEIELNNLLPLPREDTPLDELVSFKNEFNKDLKKVRRSIDNMIERVLISTSPNIKKSEIIDELNEAIYEIQKCSSRIFSNRVNPSIKFEFNMTPILLALGLASYSAITSDITLTKEITASLLAGILKITTDTKSVPSSLSDSQKEFMAFYHLEKAFPGALRHAP